MKKLMIAAMAMAAGAAFADTSIQSANIVGYSNLNTGYTHQMLGVAFENLDGNAEDGVLLKDIQGAFQVYDEIQFSYITEDGLVDFNVFTYLNEDEGGECEGWHNGDVEYVGDSVRIPFGSAVWVISQNGEALSLTTAGGVRKTAYTHTGFTDDHTLICSAFPVAFNPNAEGIEWNGIGLYDELQVAFVTEDGYVDFNVFTYLNEDEGGEGLGWHNGDVVLVTEPIAAPGQGFWLITYGDPTAISIVEPSPIAE